MTTSNPQSFTSIASLRRECWLRSYGYQSKSADDASYAKSWGGFGVLLGAATPAYAMVIRSSGTSNGVSSLLTGLLATAGVATYSFYYKWQSKKYQHLSWKWKELYNSATEAETLIKKDPKVLDAVLEKKKRVEAECNDLTDGTMFNNSTKDYLRVIEQNDLFKDWLKDKKGFF